MTWYKARLSLDKIKRCVWNKRFRLWWRQLWIRKDEFHNSLDIDPEAMMEMDKRERGGYFSNLMNRRKTAHQRDLARSGVGHEEINFGMTKNLFEDDPERVRKLIKKLDKDILQEIRKAGLNITEEHFNAIMRIWGVEEIRAMIRVETKDLLATLLGEYQEQERRLDKILAK